jgi:hypothetical protein
MASGKNTIQKIRGFYYPEKQLSEFAKNGL